MIRVAILSPAQSPAQSPNAAKIREALTFFQRQISERPDDAKARRVGLGNVDFLRVSGPRQAIVSGYGHGQVVCGSGTYAPSGLTQGQLLALAARFFQ